MPVVSQFYGLIIKMFFNDKDKHHTEHIRVEYGDYEASFDFEANMLIGYLPNKQKKLVEAWIIIHSEELKALWKVVNNGGFFKIDPLH